MKALIIGTVAVLLAIGAIGQQTTQSDASKAPAAETPSKTSSSAHTVGGVEVLSDTKGVDFGPYLTNVVRAVRNNWYNLIPPSAHPPGLERGKVSIEFAILPDGKVSSMKIVSPSGDLELDRAAWGGVTASNPFRPLPTQFTGPFLALRFTFLYNPEKSEMPSDQKKSTAPQ